MCIRDRIKRVGLIVVTTDKGLCGGLNTNILRLALTTMRQWEADGANDIRVTLSLIHI